MSLDTIRVDTFVYVVPGTRSFNSLQGYQNFFAELVPSWRSLQIFRSSLSTDRTQEVNFKKYRPQTNGLYIGSISLHPENYYIVGTVCTLKQYSLMVTDRLTCVVVRSHIWSLQ